MAPVALSLDAVVGGLVSRLREAEWDPDLHPRGPGGLFAVRGALDALEPNGRATKIGRVQVRKVDDGFRVRHLDEPDRVFTPRTHHAAVNEVVRQYDRPPAGLGHESTIKARERALRRTGNGQAADALVQRHGIAPTASREGPAVPIVPERFRRLSDDALKRVTDEAEDQYQHGGTDSSRADALDRLEHLRAERKRRDDGGPVEPGERLSADRLRKLNYALRHEVTSPDGHTVKRVGYSQYEISHPSLGNGRPRKVHSADEAMRQLDYQERARSSKPNVTKTRFAKLTDSQLDAQVENLRLRRMRRGRLSAEEKGRLDEMVRERVIRNAGTVNRQAPAAVAKPDPVGSTLSAAGRDRLPTPTLARADHPFPGGFQVRPDGTVVGVRRRGASGSVVDRGDDPIGHVQKTAGGWRNGVDGTVWRTRNLAAQAAYNQVRKPALAGV